MAEECFESANCLERVDNGGFVEVMYAKSLSEATECSRLLAEQSIPARIESAADVEASLGVAVLVPHNRLVEASELLAAHAREDDELDDDDDFADEDEDEDDNEDEYEDEDYEDEEDFAEEEDDEEYEDAEDDDEI